MNDTKQQYPLIEQEIEWLRNRLTFEQCHTHTAESWSRLTIQLRALDELERLRNLCAEAYQVVGALSTYLPDDYDPIIPPLDNLSDAAAGEPLRHESILPFMLPEDKQRELLADE